jgi:anti-anti-sigma regulatory factor
MILPGRRPSGQFILYVYGRMHYDDIFHVTHHTTLSASVYHSKAVKIRTEDVRGVTVLRLSGRLVFGDLHDRIETIVVEAKKILLDLTDASPIDRAGIHHLSKISRVVKSRQGSLKLLNVGAPARKLLSTSANQFEIYDDEGHAINSFAWIRCPKHGISYPVDGKCPRGD